VRLRGSPAHHRRLGRRFSHLWTGFTFASAGDGLAYGAVPLLAVAVNPHAIAVSAVSASDSLPWLLMALPAGHLADRFKRGPVITLANLLRAAAMIALALLVLDHRISLALLIIIVLLNGCGRAIYYTAVQAIVPGLIDTRDLEQANGVLSGTEGGAEYLAGPVAGSWLFSVGQALPFFAEGAAFVASGLTFARFRTKEPTKAPNPTSSASSIWEGVRLLFSDRRLRVLVGLVGSLALLQGMEGGVLVLLATRVWGVKESAYGVFLAIGAVGTLVGSLVAGGIVRRVGGGRTLIAAGILSGVGYLFMASASSWAAAPAFTVVCFGIGVGSVVAISLRQRLTPENLMGRVGAAWRGLVWGATPIGALAAGGIAAVAGLRTPLVIAGILQCAIAVALARPLLRLIREDRPRRAPGERRRHLNQMEEAVVPPGTLTEEQ
jgi:MFS family permease